MKIRRERIRAPNTVRARWIVGRAMPNRQFFGEFTMILCGRFSRRSSKMHRSVRCAMYTYNVRETREMEEARFTRRTEGQIKSKAWIH